MVFVGPIQDNRDEGLFILYRLETGSTQDNSIEYDITKTTTEKTQSQN